MCSKLTVMSMTTCFSSVIAVSFEKVSVKRSSPNFASNITGMLLFRPALEFRAEPILRLSSSGLRFYLNIDFLPLSFVQVDHKVIEFKLSQRSALRKHVLEISRFEIKHFWGPAQTRPEKASSPPVTSLRSIYSGFSEICKWHVRYQVN